MTFSMFQNAYISHVIIMIINLYGNKEKETEH